MAIIGSIIGDIIGSQYEEGYPLNFNPNTCSLFSHYCSFTDDTVMSLSIKYAIDNNISYVDAMHRIGLKYYDCGYGRRFYNWIINRDKSPYYSYGNGAAMRVSYIGEYFDIIDDVILQAEKSSIVSHNHPEGIKGAITTAVCIWMAKHNKSKNEIYNYVLTQYPSNKYKYSVEYDLKYIISHYDFDVSCMATVPVAIKCFLESDSYESFIRNVFLIDCDTDTICCIGGGIAEEYYGTTGLNNDEILKKYLDEYLLNILYKKGK